MTKKTGLSVWEAASPSKRWTELFFLSYSLVWITWISIIVIFQFYEWFEKLHYLFVGFAAGCPCFLLPIIVQPKADVEKPLFQRYWVKANVWIAIFSFIGNYFWTHYFYQVLGASYTMPSWDLNQVPLPQSEKCDLEFQVPIALYFVTHAYFCLYHALSNILIRTTRNLLTQFGVEIQCIGEALIVFLFAYFAAYMETYTIEQYPYYSFVDRKPMYTIGSLFYAIYFFVSFPLFFRIDETPSEKKWTLGEVALNSLAAGMLVTILLDLWRLGLGPLVELSPDQKAHGPPWLMATRNSRF